MYETLFKKHIDITWRDATTKQHFFMCFSKSGNLFFVNADTFEEFFDTDPDLQAYQLCITALDEISDCILGSASASLTYQPAEEVSLQKNHYQNTRIPQRELYLESISVCVIVYCIVLLKNLLSGPKSVEPVPSSRVNMYSDSFGLTITAFIS